MLLLIFINTYTKASCISAIGNLLADTLTDPIQEIFKLSPYFYFSGKGINDFGLQEDCQKNYQYGVFQFFVPDTPASVNIGLCLTKQCSIDDINHSIQKIKKWVIPVAQYITKIDLTDYELILLDSQKQPKSTYLTFVIITIFMIFILVQIFITWYQTKNIKQINTKKLTIQLKNQEEEQSFLNLETMDTELKLPKLEQTQSNLNNFNIYKNYEICCKPIQTNYQTLNFIRLIGFLMCVFGNIGISMLLQCDFIQVLHYSKHYILLIVFGCLYSVEIFLWLSGFFAVLSLNKINCLNHIINRILKFLPLIIIVILINTFLIPYLYDGPRWFYIERYTKCGKWWQNLLFINNFDNENYCVLWMWQLSLDIQLTILCAFIMVIYKRNQNIAIYMTLFLLILSQSYIIYICIKKEYSLPYFSAFSTDIYKSFYYRPYYRAPPYFIGMLTAFFSLKYKKNIKPCYSNIMIFTGIIIILYLTFGWYDVMQFGQNYYPKIFSQLYEGTMRTFYSIGITLFCLPNIIGQNNFFYQILNYQPIKYLVQFTFSGYLIHMIIIEVIIASFYNRLDFNVQSIAQMYTGCLIIIAIFAFLFKLFIELPMRQKITK